MCFYIQCIFSKYFHLDVIGLRFSSRVRCALVPVCQCFVGTDVKGEQCNFPPDLWARPASSAQLSPAGCDGWAQAAWTQWFPPGETAGSADARRSDALECKAQLEPIHIHQKHKSLESDAALFLLPWFLYFSNFLFWMTQRSVDEEVQSWFIV